MDGISECLIILRTLLNSHYIVVVVRTYKYIHTNTYTVSYMSMCTYSLHHVYIVLSTYVCADMWKYYNAVTQKAYLKSHIISHDNTNLCALPK